MIEIVIAMFLLAVLALAFLPMLVHGLTQSVANSTLASATQLVTQQVEILRSKTLCTELAPMEFTVPRDRAVGLKVSRIINGVCPDVGYPRTISVTITVKRADNNAVVSSAASRIFVGAK